MNLLPIVAIALPLAGGLSLAALPHRAGRLAPPVGVAASGLTLAAVVWVAVLFDRDESERAQFVTAVAWAPTLRLDVRLGVDGLSLPFVLLTALLVFCCLLYTIRVRPAGGRIRAFVALVLLGEAAMLGAFLALDLLLFFVLFGAVVITMWLVLAWWGEPDDEPGRVAAASTYVLYTTLGLSIMLLGFLLVGAHTGTFSIPELASRGGAGMPVGAQLAAASAIVGGLAVTVPVWPLHTWLPGAHTAAPTVGSVLLAGVVLKLGSYGLVRLAVPVVPDGFRLIAPVLGGLAVVGVVYAALACLAQRDLKRVVAYSSVGHMGFVTLGVATMTPAGLNGSVFAGVAHGLVVALLFFLAGAVRDRHGTTDLATLGGGMFARLPRLGALVAFAAIAAVGAPGLAGFWGGLLALLGAFEPAAVLSRPFFLTLLAVAMLGAVLTAHYLLVTVRRVCQGRDAIGSRLVGIRDVTGHEATSWGPLVALTVLLGIWPGPLLSLVDPVMQAVAL